MSSWRGGRVWANRCTSFLFRWMGWWYRLSQRMLGWRVWQNWGMARDHDWNIWLRLGRRVAHQASVNVYPTWSFHFIGHCGFTLILHSSLVPGQRAKTDAGDGVSFHTWQRSLQANVSFLASVSERILSMMWEHTLDGWDANLSQSNTHSHACNLA